MYISTNVLRVEYFSSLYSLNVCLGVCVCVCEYFHLFLFFFCCCFCRQPFTLAYSFEHAYTALFFIIYWRWFYLCVNICMYVCWLVGWLVLMCVYRFVCLTEAWCVAVAVVVFIIFLVVVPFIVLFSRLNFVASSSYRCSCCMSVYVSYFCCCWLLRCLVILTVLRYMKYFLARLLGYFFA